MKLIEKFRPEMVGKMNSHLAKVLGSKVGKNIYISNVSLGVDRKGNDVFPASIEEKYFFTVNYNNGNLESLTSYNDNGFKKMDKTIVFTGYNIVQVIGELVEFLSDFVGGTLENRESDMLSESFRKNQ
jgi:hypothetical protein